MDSDQGEIPARPQSPFVSNLRLQVALERPPEVKQQFETQPSVGTWLTPRSARHGRSSVVRFGENEVVPISVREKAERVLIELNFKGTCAKPFKLENIDASLTVRNVKELCEMHCSLPPDQLRLLYKGVILQDSQCLQDTKVTNKATLFLVKGASASSDANGQQASSSSAVAAADEEEDEENYAFACLSRPPVVMLCIECGVNPGRLLTDGLCSICFRELVMKENAALKKRKEEAKRKEEESKRLEVERKRDEEEAELKRQKNVSRCYKCNKKIGLTGFQCQCGYFYCSAHRHAEDHDCAFDHKAHGRDILAQQSPQKLQRSSFE